MRLILLGSPGSGKGTQAKLLSERLGLRDVGTGDILREAMRQGTPEGKQVGVCQKAGKVALPAKAVVPLVQLTEAPAMLRALESMMTASALFLVMGTFGSWALAVNNRSVEVGAEDGFQ